MVECWVVNREDKNIYFLVKVLYHHGVTPIIPQKVPPPTKPGDYYIKVVGDSITIGQCMITDTDNNRADKIVYLHDQSIYVAPEDHICFRRSDMVLMDPKLVKLPIDKIFNTPPNKEEEMIK